MEKSDNNRELKIQDTEAKQSLQLIGKDFRLFPSLPTVHTYLFHVGSNRRTSVYNFIHQKLVQDGGFAGVIQADHH